MISPLLLSVLGNCSLMSIASGQGTFPSREVFIQSAALLAGLALAAIVLTLGYRYFIDLEKFLYPAGILLLLSVYIPGLGISSYGSRSWISIGVLTFQPSEIAKLIFILVLASYLSRKKDQLASLSGIAKAGLYALPYILIVAREDLGSGCVFCVIWVFMIFCSGLELKRLWRALLVLRSLLPLAYSLLAGYQKNRIDAFLHPSDLSLPGNYQVWNAKVAIGSGRLFGQGIPPRHPERARISPRPRVRLYLRNYRGRTGIFRRFFVILLFAFFLYHAWKTAKYASRSRRGLSWLQGSAACFSFSPSKISP